MATKKRGGGGGSNLGLIITLVFFVLSTIILGVTTYLGYSELDSKESKVKKAVAELETRTKERNWIRAKENILRQYINEPSGKGLETKEIMRIKGEIDGGVFPDMAGQADAEDFKGLLIKLNKTMPWDAKTQDVPAKTYLTLINERDAAYTAVGKQLANEKAQREAAEARADAARKEADANKAEYAAQIKMLKEQSATELVKDRKEIERLRLLANEENKGKGTAQLAANTAADTIRKLETDKGKLQGKIAELTTEVKRTKEDRDEYKDKYVTLKEKSGADDRVVEAKLLDKVAADELQTWRKNFKVVDIDRTGKSVYINLGSSDNVQPQLTFSIHEKGADGKLKAVPKGTLEVVAVSGPHLSRARVTSIRDETKDPILKGDYLFRAKWDPSRRSRVAIAGLVDLDDDHTDRTEQFVRLLKRQNVDIDAMVNARDDKAPKLEGTGITNRTDYLVIADSLDDVNHPKARDRAYKDAYEALLKQLREKASANAVPVISLKKYRDMIGYRPARVLTAPASKLPSALRPLFSATATRPSAPAPLALPRPVPAWPAPAAPVGASPAPGGLPPPAPPA